VRVLDANHYMFYDKWYYTAVRESLAFFPLTDKNFALLGKKIVPSISEKQVENAIRLLVELKLVEKDQQGFYKRTNALLSTGSDIRSLTLNNFIINNMMLAAKAINNGSKDCNFSSVTFSVSKKDFEEIQDEIRRARRKIMEIAQYSEDPERVYQLNVQLFPMTESNSGGES